MFLIDIYSNNAEIERVGARWWELLRGGLRLVRNHLFPSQAKSRSSGIGAFFIDGGYTIKQLLPNISLYRTTKDHHRSSTTTDKIEKKNVI